LKKLSFLLFLSLVWFLLACSEDENELNFDSCIVESIQFSENSRLVFQTISGGMIYQINQENLIEDTPEIVASFAFSYFADSIAVRNQLQERPSRYPYLWVLLEDEKPKRIVRYFPTGAVQLIHTIDYSKENLIRVDIERVASNLDTLNAGYGEYYLDDKNNVSRLVVFGIDEDNPGQLRLYQDQNYSYDDVTNPIKEFYLPFFNTTSLVNPGFFSVNNIVSEEGTNGSAFYNLTYGPDGELSSSNSSDQQVFFQYLNCN